MRIRIVVNLCNSGFLQHHTLSLKLSLPEPFQKVELQESHNLRKWRVKDFPPLLFVKAKERISVRLRAHPDEGFREKVFKVIVR